MNSYTWDRANRLLSMGGADYQYDGEGRRVQQTVSSVVTKYLLDIQPGLAVVLSQTEDSDTTRFVHAPRGIHARQDASSDWHWSVQDGLGTVRMETDNSVAVEGAQNLDPFGNLIDLNGTIGTPFGFTGELVDGSGLLDLRARRYNAGLGVFASLDPLEGYEEEPMSLNGYGYVQGDPINFVDPSGNCPQNPWWNDIPGQRCVWLANELHQKYAWPIEVLMSKDVADLEWIYLWGNANSTFNESSWSQTLRGNRVATAAVVGGAVVLALLLSGGTATPFVLAVLGGAVAGGATGAAVGTAFGEAMYSIAVSGECGCQRQNQTIQMGKDLFVARTRETAALYGVAYGGLYAAGPAGQVIANTGSIVQGAEGVGNAISDINANQLNRCNFIDLVLGIGGIAGGALGFVRGYRLGRETRINDDVRVAPYGNRTGNQYGELPHYHWRRVDPITGETFPGQGIGRHRPWQPMSPDTSFWDRF